MIMKLLSTLQFKKGTWWVTLFSKRFSWTGYSNDRKTENKDDILDHKRDGKRERDSSLPSL